MAARQRPRQQPARQRLQDVVVALRPGSTSAQKAGGGRHQGHEPGRGGEMGDVVMVLAPDELQRRSTTPTSSRICATARDRLRARLSIHFRLIELARTWTCS